MYRIVDRRKFKCAVKEFFYTVMMIAAVIWFCAFIYQHSGLNIDVEDVGTKTVREYVAYEYVTQTSPENSRVKEDVPQKVVYRYCE